MLPLLTLVGLLAAPPSGDAPGRVQAWLDSWHSLSGRFEQVLTSPTLPSARVESGRFHVVRPDRMRWDYRTPERKLAVTDGVHTWLYLPSDRQVILGRLDTLRQDGAVSLLLSGSLRLQEAFRIEAQLEDSEEIALEMVPRQPSETISRIWLRADPVGRVLGFTVTDSTGNEVSWRFSEIETDPRLDDGLFTFEIPDGVEVQELEPEHVAP